MPEKFKSFLFMVADWASYSRLCSRHWKTEHIPESDKTIGQFMRVMPKVKGANPLVWVVHQ